MLAQGYRVAVTGRRADVGEAVAKELDPEGNKVIYVQCDVSSYASQSGLFKAVWAKWARLDVFVANAGFVDRSSVYDFAGRSRSIDDLPAEPDLSCTDTNVKGVIYGTMLSTHFMRHNPTPGGKIIITGSIIGIHPCPTFPEYCATKAAAHQWARTMAPVLKKQENITINVVMPGAYDTPAMPGFAEAFLPEQYVSFLALASLRCPSRNSFLPPPSSLAKKAGLTDRRRSLTLKDCLMSAYDEFLHDKENKTTAQTVETGHDQLYYYDVPESQSGGVGYRNTLVYEPWFSIVHGGRSELENALQESPRKKAA